MGDKKYYWLRLKNDFFKRHDIKIISSMPNGRDIVLLYIKLMVESVDHEGYLRFSDAIPYTVEMISTITETKPGIVNKAMDVLKQFGLFEQMEDGTFFLPKVPELIGFETEWASKKRTYRGQLKDNVRTMSEDKKDNVRQEKEIEKEIDIDISKAAKPRTKAFVPPTLEEVQAYCKQRNSPVDPKVFFEYFDAGHWIDSEGKPVKNWKQKIITWEGREKSGISDGRIDRSKVTLLRTSRGTIWKVEVGEREDNETF